MASRMSRALIALCLVACGVVMVGKISPARADDAAASAVLSEETQPPSAKRYAGSLAWSTEPASGAGAGDLVLRGDAQIPDGGLALTLTLVRNRDAAVSASHVITLEFQPAPGFAGGAIGSVAGILLKAHLGAKSLVGQVTKTGDRSFRIELTTDDAARAQNLQLLADSGWLTVAMVYADGRHAELMLYKGTSGRGAFERALASWN